MSDDEKKKEKEANEADQQINGVQLGTYLSWVKNELDSENACLELPFTIMLLLVFSLAALYHLRQEWTYVVEHSWKFDLSENANFAWSHNFGHKTLHDVNSIADFWSWFRIGFLPLVVQPSWSHSEDLDSAFSAAQATNSTPFDSSMLPSQYDLKFGYPPDDSWVSVLLPVRDDYLHYNKIVAGIRLRQERAEASWESCLVPKSVPEDLMKQWLGKPCMPAKPSYELTPMPEDAEAFSEPARVEWLLTERDDLHTLIQKALDMEDGCSQLKEKSGGEGRDCLCNGCQNAVQQTPGGPLMPGPWADEYTQRIQLGIVSYNQNYGLVSLVTVNFFINRGGHIYKLVHVQSSWVSIWCAGNFLDVVFMLFCDLVWVLGVTKVFIAEVKDMVYVIQSSKSEWYTAIWEDYLAFWNIVDWVSILCAYAVLACYIRLSIETGICNLALEQKASALTSMTRAESELQSADIFGKVESMVAAESDLRLVLMFYPMVVMARLFKSFDAQPRLAVVTRTLMTASQDMLHFFVVFFSVVFCIAVNGVLLFGQDLESFTTLDRAGITCFRALFGEWDWDRMKVVGRVLAGTWMFAWVWIVVVLLLNMLLAILMDAYATVKAAAAEALGLPDQISEMVRRRRQTQNKERVRLNDIWDAYFRKFMDEKEMLSSKLIITAKDVMKQVRGIPPKQAKRTVANAKAKLENSTSQPYGQTDVRDQIVLAQGRARLMREEVSQIRQSIQDTCRIAGLPKPTSLALREGTVQVVKVLKDNVDILSEQVVTAISSEREQYKNVQANIDLGQREMTFCAFDARQKLHLMQKGMEELTQLLQSHAAKEHMKQVLRPVEAYTPMQARSSLDVVADISRV
mmetsp:Transcript_90191/g.160642  ORF Transcript_90191/g.160642 Transcript_90191/m.160642 type:complete len:855 (+) Transcript_90191:87-2651(+)